MAVKWIKPFASTANSPSVWPEELPPLPPEVANVPLSDILTEMKEGVKYLSIKDQQFFGALRDAATKYKNLSQKQDYWFRKLYARALGLDSKPDALGPVSVGSLSGLYALFKKAKKHLKYPKLVLASPFGGELMLGLAGPNAKVPNSLNITDGKPFGEAQYFGRVTEEGDFQPNQKFADKVGPLTALLKELSENPMGAAKKNAVLNGKCMCCNKTLTDPKSTAMGIGPVCAENWGLYDEWKKAEAILKAE